MRGDMPSVAATVEWPGQPNPVVARVAHSQRERQSEASGTLRFSFPEFGPIWGADTKGNGRTPHVEGICLKERRTLALRARRAGSSQRQLCMDA